MQYKKPYIAIFTRILIYRRCA